MHKEKVWPERTPGSCRGRFCLKVSTSGVPQVELELRGGLGWEGGGRLGVPQGLELYVLVAQRFLATKEGRTTNNYNSKIHL